VEDFVDTPSLKHSACLLEHARVSYALLLRCESVGLARQSKQKGLDADKAGVGGVLDTLRLRKDDL